MAKPILSIIIVSYNTKVLTAQAIEAVGFRPEWELIVVDNNSRDGSADYLSHRYGKKILLIKRSQNGGFAVANNEGIQHSQGKYVLLLNSDTLVHNGALQDMIATMDANPRLGVLSCKLSNPDGSYQPQGGALPTLFNLSAWWLWPIPGQVPFVSAYQDTREISQRLRAIGWVGGTAMMIRRELIEQIGGLDEQIFMYAEDVEFCLRASKSGWKVGLLSEAEITHIGSASGNSNRAKLGELRGLLYVFKKHFSWVELVSLRVVFFLGALLRYLLFGILYGKSDAKKLYADVAKLARSENL